MLGHPLRKVEKKKKNCNCYAKKGEEMKPSKMLNQNHDRQEKSGSQKIETNKEKKQ